MHTLDIKHHFSTFQLHPSCQHIKISKYNLLMAQLTPFVNSQALDWQHSSGVVDKQVARCDCAF